MSEFKQKLVIDHAEGAVYGKEGIRDQFVYRHFGVEEATGGKYGAHLIRGGTARRRSKPIFTPTSIS